jgi:putative transposase
MSGLKLLFRRDRFTPLTNSQWKDIEKIVDTGRKRQNNLRRIVNAILKINRLGMQWRNLEEKPYLYPPWQSVYYYFRKWQRTGVWSIILTFLVEKERVRQGRHRQASAVAVDSQSVKKGSLISLDTGIDGNKNVNGRKRHLAVDSLGLPLALHVSAANKHDGQQGIELLWQLEKASSRLELIRADHAYQGYFVECADYYNWTVEITQKPESQQGFIPQTGRWQVERSFAWFNFFRRLSKDYEKTVESSVTFMQLAFIDILLARNPK